MTTERPLDALFPELGTSHDLPAEPVHPRVLEVDVEGQTEWVFACWRDPGDPRALHGALKRLVEATILAELSQPPAEVSARQQTIAGLRLVCFDEVTGGIAPAVEAFGFEPAEYAPERFLARMTALSEEAEALGWRLPPHPTSVWYAPIARPGGALEERQVAVEREMAKRMGEDVWGHTPGGPSRLLTRLVEEDLGGSLGADFDGLRRLEGWLVSRQVGPIRWIRPLLFQALCDYVGVAAQAVLRARVAWGECVPDESGLAPPPLFRVMRGGQPVHIPVGLHVVRWCVMPLREGEAVPSLAEWVVDEFGD